MSHSTPRPRIARKLLSASIGVATISYVAAATSCGTSNESNNPDGGTTGPGSSDAQQEFVVGNLAPLPTDAQQEFIVGNLAPVPTDAQEEFVVGNLAPLPTDAQMDNSSGDVTTDSPSDVTTETSTGPDGNPADVIFFDRIVGNLAPPPQDH